MTEGQNEDIVVKLNYDSLTKRLPSSVEFLHEGKIHWDMTHEGGGGGLSWPPEVQPLRRKCNVS